MDSGKFECPLPTQHHLLILPQQPSQHILFRMYEHETYILKHELNDFAPLGILIFHKIPPHHIYNLYSYIILLGEINKTHPSTHECPSHDTFPSKTLFVCIFRGLSEHELKAQQWLGFALWMKPVLRHPHSSLFLVATCMLFPTTTTFQLLNFRVELLQLLPMCPPM